MKKLLISIVMFSITSCHSAEADNTDAFIIDNVVLHVKSKECLPFAERSKNLLDDYLQSSHPRKKEKLQKAIIKQQKLLSRCLNETIPDLVTGDSINF